MPDVIDEPRPDDPAAAWDRRAGRYETEVVEVTMLLSIAQFEALEAAAGRQNLTVAQMTRRVLADFLGDRAADRV